jgi:transcriptional regulator with XRE-family HTH domain
VNGYAAALRALGQVIRAQRRARGLSQEDFAERAQFDRTYPSLLERGLRDPKLSTLLRVCVALDCSPLDLLGAAHGSAAHRTLLDGNPPAAGGSQAVPLSGNAVAQRPTSGTGGTKP